MKKYIKGLVKITSRKCFAQDFRDGKLYMNELRYFTKCEQRELEDPAEARAATLFYKNLQVNIAEESLLCTPVFCMYGLYDSKYGGTHTVSICPKMKAFGEYAVVVTDAHQFFKRLTETGLEFSPIKYQDPDRNDIDSRIPYMPIYRKLEYFNYQQEFRIMKPNLWLTKNSEEKFDGCTTKDEDHYEHMIPGGLHDITSEIIPIEQILQPNKVNVDLSVEWDRMLLDNYVRYENPRLKKTGGGLR